MTIEERMKNLERISFHDGVPYGRAHDLFDAESAHEREVLRYQGYLVSSDALKCFYLETTELTNSHIRPQIKTPMPPSYALFLARMANGFQALCGAERAALKGYPYQGYTLLRNIYDNLLMTSAVLQTLTTFEAAEGIGPAGVTDMVAVKKARKETEYKTKRQMVGHRSGLSSEVIAELKVWDDLFDFETHGSRLSMTHTMNWLRGLEPLPVLPAFNEMAFAMFMNRYLEVCWMFHRLVPATQPAGIPLPEEWHEKWGVIDVGLRAQVESLSTDLGKKIGAIMVEFVSAKFPQNSRSSFPL